MRVGLNNAATSRLLVNSAVIPINFYKQLQICISIYSCVGISLFLNRFL